MVFRLVNIFGISAWYVFCEVASRELGNTPPPGNIRCRSRMDDPKESLRYLAFCHLALCH